jgi:fructokinase
MGYRMVGIGEALWDLLPSGPQLGGAPANFAYHAHALGGEAQVVSRVGSDQLGRDIVVRIEAMGLSSAGLQTDETAPTGTVTVALDGNGVPSYTIHENTAWDRIAATPGSLALARTADAVCFGSLAQRSPVSRESIQCLVSAAPAAAWRVFDINLRQHYYDRDVIERSLQLANVLKLNDDELPVLAGMFGIPGGPEAQIESLAAGFNLNVVALTRGGRGSLLYRDGNWSDCAPAPVKVVDTVGAGDSFTAALVLGLLHGDSLDTMHAFASEVAAYVCTCAGATPTLPERFQQHFRQAAGGA